MAENRKDMHYGAARISGAGSLVWPAGGVTSILRTGTGVYEISLEVTERDCEIDTQAITEHPIQCGIVVSWLSPNVLAAKTLVWGELADLDFYLSVKRWRTGNSSVPAPIPLTAPPNGSSILSSAVWRDDFATEQTAGSLGWGVDAGGVNGDLIPRSEEHTSELQSPCN